MFVVVFFLAPLVLVGRMSLNDWPPARRRPGDQLPAELHRDPRQPPVLAAVASRSKYTVIVTVLLLALALGLALLVQDAAAGPASSAPRSSCRARSASPPRRCSSGGCTRHRSARSARPSRPRPHRASRSTSSAPRTRRPVLHVVPGRLAVRRVQHADPAGRAAGASPSRSTRRPRWTAPPLADLRRSRCRSCARRSRSSLILCVTGSLLAFDQFYILTNGGPDNTHRHRRAGHLPRGLPALQPRHRRGAFGRSLLVVLVLINVVQLRCSGARATTEQPDAYAHDPLERPRPDAVLRRSPAALALIFLFPLVWSGCRLGQSAAQHLPGRRLRARQLRRSCSTTATGLSHYLLEQRHRVRADGRCIVAVVSLLGGYAFARFRFPGKSLLFLLTLAILMVPYATILVPLYIVLGDIGLQNSLIGLASCWSCSSCRSRSS